jgi:hypothetical protein
MWLRQAMRRMFKETDLRTSERPPVAIEPLEGRRLLSGAVQADLNGDGHQDLVWRNYTTGNNAIWFMNNTTSIGTAALPPAVNLNWQIVCTGVVDDNGTPDLIWRNSTTGDNAVWFLSHSGQNVTVTGTVALPPATAQFDPFGPLDWQGAGVNDFNQDGHPDILYRNINDGRIAVWYMGGGSDGSGITGTAIIGTSTNQAWRIRGTGDFNGDGSPDIVFRNSANGQNAVWYVANSQATGAALLPTAPSLSWQLTTAEDLDGDGRPDLIWRNASTGVNAVWYMNDTVATSTAALPSAIDTNWQIIGAQTL